MSMAFLAVIERELRVIAGRRSTYWTRFAFALAGVAAAAGQLYVSNQVGRSGPWVGPLQTCTFFLTIFFVVRGVKLTADCLSREKREGTLPLLFLTHLHAHGIVLAKLASALAHSLDRLLALAPILVLLFLLAGLGAGVLLRLLFA